MHTWEQGRQLKEVKEGEKRYRYTYNADGIRTRKEANGITHEYYLSGSTIIGERRTGEGTDVLLTYHYDINGISGFRYRNNVTGASKRVYYRKNIQGDIIGILDGEGEMLVTYVYDAWGNILLASGNAELQRLNPFMYRGYYRDTETGWYYLNSRYYDPNVCRFLNADDISFIDPESFNNINLYTYCGNNPVMYVDPSGHELEWYHWLAIAIGAVLVVASAATLIALGAGAAISLVVLGAAKGALVGAAIGGIAGRLSIAKVDVRKFSEYALDPVNSKGKHVIFEKIWLC